jgi:hypothetical protein
MYETVVEGEGGVDEGEGVTTEKKNKKETRENTEGCVAPADC